MKRTAAMAALLLSLGMAGTCHATGTAAPAAAASQPAASTATGIPFKREPETTGSMATRTAVAWLVCLAVGGGIIYVLQRRLGLRPGLGLGLKKQRRLQVIEMQRIGAKSALVLVRWDQEELLLAQGEGGTSLLARAPAGPAPSASEATMPGPT